MIIGTLLIILLLIVLKTKFFNFSFEKVVCEKFLNTLIDVKIDDVTCMNHAHALV